MSNITSSAPETKKQNEEMCSVHKRYQGLTFDDFIPPCETAQFTLAVTKDFVTNFNCSNDFEHDNRNLIFYGNTGTGKTMLASIITQQVIESGHTALYTSGAKLERQFRDIQNFHPPTPDLLVIDDMNCIYGPVPILAYLRVYQTVFNRLVAGKSTILISTIEQNMLGYAKKNTDNSYGKLLIFDWQSQLSRPSA